MCVHLCVWHAYLSLTATLRKQTHNERIMRHSLWTPTTQRNQPFITPIGYAVLSRYTAVRKQKAELLNLIELKCVVITSVFYL